VAVGSPTEMLGKNANSYTAEFLRRYLGQAFPAVPSQG